MLSRRGLFSVLLGGAAAVPIVTLPPRDGLPDPGPRGTGLHGSATQSYGWNARTRRWELEHTTVLADVDANLAEFRIYDASGKVTRVRPLDRGSYPHWG